MVVMEQSVIQFTKANSNKLKGLQPNDVMFWTDKSGRLFYVVHEPSSNTSIAYHKFKAYQLVESDGKYKDEQIGFLDYTILQKPGEIWINNIQVANESLLGLGIGHSLLVTFEQFAYEHYYRNVSGKFYPTEPAPNAKVVREFYENHGYSMESYDWILDKTLRHSNYLKNCDDKRLVKESHYLEQNDELNLQKNWA